MSTQKNFTDYISPHKSAGIQQEVKPGVIYEPALTVTDTGTTVPPHASQLAELTRKANAYDRIYKLLAKVFQSDYDYEREAGLIALREFGMILG